MSRQIEAARDRITIALTVLDTDNRPSAVTLAGVMGFAIQSEISIHARNALKPDICFWALDITAEANIMWC